MTPQNSTGLTRMPPAVEPTTLLDSTVSASISSRACSPRRITSESSLAAGAGPDLEGSALRPGPLTGAACRASAEACGGCAIQDLELRVLYMVGFHSCEALQLHHGPPCQNLAATSRLRIQISSSVHLQDCVGNSIVIPWLDANKFTPRQS